MLSICIVFTSNTINMKVREEKQLSLLCRKYQRFKNNTLYITLSLSEVFNNQIHKKFKTTLSYFAFKIRSQSKRSTPFDELRLIISLIHALQWISDAVYTLIFTNVLFAFLFPLISTRSPLLSQK